MMRLLAICFTLLFCTITQPAHAQLGGLGALATVSEIRAALNDALKGVQNATITAGGEARSLGNSLQANIQNVLADIDSRLNKQLDKRVDQLDKGERQFMTDARELVFRAREASVALTKVLSDETQQTIGEADIAAYNASYSLPCRTQIPRIVYWRPTSTIVRDEEITVFIHGNFLNYGEGAKVTLDGKPAKFTRNTGVIAVKLPADAVKKVTDVSSMAINIDGLATRTLKPRTIWFGCGEKLDRTPPSSLTVELSPRYHYRVSGEVWATYKEWTEPFVYSSGAIDRGSDDCDHNEDVSFQQCVPAENHRAISGATSLRSASKPSSLGPARASGDFCILFPARVAGSGYDHYAFGVKNCKGSAWLNGNWSVTAKRIDAKESGHSKFDDDLPVAQYSHAKNYSLTPRGEDWRWRYVVKIDQLRGSHLIQTETLTDTRLDNGKGWISSISDGVFSVVLPGEP